MGKLVKKIGTLVLVMVLLACNGITSMMSK